jgi:predicted nucleic acid-binding protein
MARLIETSVWIDFTRAKTPMARKIAIQPWILDADACLCEAVAFEVLRHATPSERPQIEAQFATLPLLPTPSLIWREATRLGQQCRDKGLNAGSIDLIIAATAIHYDAELITLDADYAAIARIAPLKFKLLV